MKNIFFRIITITICIILYIVISFLKLNNYNKSVQIGFIIILNIYFSLIILGIIFSKIIFNIKLKPKFKKMNFEKITLKQLYLNILKSILFLFIYFSISYLIIYTYGNKLFSKFTNLIGIINSCKYISKIFFITLPLYSFEITYLEYCTFLNANICYFILKKILIWIAITQILTYFYEINGFLYTKLVIDILYLPYYIIKLRKLIKLTKLKEGKNNE